MRMLTWMGLALLCAGCAGYRRGSAVPEAVRSVNVVAFENATPYPMAGAIAAQQLADALAEDGTFRLESYERARLRVQGRVLAANATSVRYDRNNIVVPEEYRVALELQLYVHDTVSGETLVNGKTIAAAETMLTRHDFQTGMTDALPRVARKLAQNVLDELHALPYRQSAVEAPARP